MQPKNKNEPHLEITHLAQIISPEAAKINKNIAKIKQYKQHILS